MTTIMILYLGVSCHVRLSVDRPNISGGGVHVNINGNLEIRNGNLTPETRRESGSFFWCESF
jgi:hypothetical protein